MKKNVYDSDTDDDSISNKTVDSGDVDIECNIVQQRSQCHSNFNGSSFDPNNLQLPAAVPDRASISHISSVALKNSTDITFGNKTLYNGPITVNQFGLETPPATTDLGE